MGVPANFTFEKPVEMLQFKDKEIVHLKIASVTEFSDQQSGSFGLNLTCEVVKAPLTEKHEGERILLGFPFVTKNGRQNRNAYMFMTAMFPDVDDGKFPFHFLEGMKFQAVSKLNSPSPDSDKVYQNWENFKLLSTGTDDTSF